MSNPEVIASRLLSFNLMYSYEKRLQTFSEWPFREDCQCTPELMAKAGFVHCPSENEPDVACCFYCLRELEGWEPEDNPCLAPAVHQPPAVLPAVSALRTNSLTTMQGWKRQTFGMVDEAGSTSSKTASEAPRSHLSAASDNKHTFTHCLSVLSPHQPSCLFIWRGIALFDMNTKLKSMIVLYSSDEKAKSCIHFNTAM
ncbi:baculoviral IAP repeat-containing protein 5b isoform X1 [Pimephales promelas]|uniref:baculoviral IAP repeat-containing protein 5b isoform X1 n=1 Tax=Pimephales promelas TaxID=90988 RepID=UPI001955EED8|nr:baculoviral IAP repeat-containing protein 5b isoform X1 [Pimephales promelas]